MIRGIRGRIYNSFAGGGCVLLYKYGYILLRVYDTHISRAVLTALLAPGQGSEPAPLYTTTRRNKDVNVDNIKNIFIEFVLPNKISV